MDNSPEVINNILNNELFSCESILKSNENLKQIKDFLVKRQGAKGLEFYLKENAISDEYSGQARTFLVKDKDTNEIACYFSLKTGLVSVNEKRFLFHKEFDSMSGIELSNFAVNDNYKDNHPEIEHIGMIVFSEFIYPIVEYVSNFVGVSLLYLFALPDENLVTHYQKLHFQRLPRKEERSIHRRIRPRYDKSCIFMCQRLK